MTNKLTTIFGTLAAACGGAATQTTGTVHGVLILVSVISGAIFAFAAKDYNVTGGAKQQ